MMNDAAMFRVHETWIPLPKPVEHLPAVMLRQAEVIVNLNLG
jgi:hypothetical protein